MIIVLGILVFLLVDSELCALDGGTCTCLIGRMDRWGRSLRRSK